MADRGQTETGSHWSDTTSDWFYFANAAFGQHTIRNWDDGTDWLDLSAAGIGYADFDKSGQDGGTLLELRSDPAHWIFIEDVDPEQFDESDFT